MQERQFPPFDVEDPTHAEREALRRLRARRARSLVAGVGAGLLALFAVGCPEPGDLENADVYPAPMPTAGTGTAGSSSSAGTGGSGGGGSTIAACETSCVTTIFTTQCKICHGSTTKLSGTLDLETMGVSARLKDKPAEHMGSTPGPCPTGDKLIDSATPANSWLLKKVTDMQGTCGTVMPAPTALPAADQTCLTTYVNCVAGGT